MRKKVTAFCRQKGLLYQGDRVLVGLSGGADSVCLFLVLLAMKEEWELELVPVHVNHNLRGEEAAADERFCEELCRAHGVQLHKVSVRVADLAGEHGWTLEEAGRNARYEVFHRLKEELHCNSIAVAHHKNDQAETVLFQMLRGSRLKGLAGMEARREDIIRPLLCVTRAEIEEFLGKENQSFCIDRTNLEEDYTRNCIRHQMIPLAQKLQPRAVEHISETAEYLGRVEAFLAGMTEKCYREAVVEQAGQVRLSIELLEAQEALLSERVVYLALCAVAGQKKDITAFAVSQCMELIQKQTGRSVQLPLGLTAIREYDVIRIFKEQEEAEAVEILVEEFPFEVCLPDGNGRLHLELAEMLENTAISIEKMGGIPKSNYTKWYDYDTINSSVSLRTPKTEDEIALYVDGRGKKVFDVMADAKIPKEERYRKVVLAAGEQVLWIPGIRSSEAYRVTEQTKRILIATID